MKTLLKTGLEKFITFFCIGCLFIVPTSFAQEAGKIRAGFDIGCLTPRYMNGQGFGGFGFCGATEMRYNLQDNMNVGLKAEVTEFLKHKDYVADVLSFSVTYDYYFHYKGSRNAPFIGAGLGYFYCVAWDYQSNPYNYKYSNPTCFLRTGFEFQKFRVSFAYNLIRNSIVEEYSRNNDYLSLSFGFYIGGGKWK